MKKYLFTLVAVLMGATFSAPSRAQEVPHYINYQAVLRDDGGNIVTAPTVDLKFQVIDQDGSELYQEIQHNVQVMRGMVNVMIGEGSVPNSSPPLPTGGVPLEALDPQTGSKTLRVTFGDNLPNDMEMGIVPSALWSEKALGVVENSIGEHEIKDGAIKLRHLGEVISFSNLSGQIADSQIPNTISRAAQLSAHINAPTRGAHTAYQIATEGPFAFSASTNVEEVLKDVNNAIADEVFNRRHNRDTLTEANTLVTTNLNTHTSATTAHGSDGTVVGLNTLNNAITTHAAQTQGVHGINTTPGNQLVGTNDTQTLLNKTLENPIIHGGRITGDITVDDGVLIDGVDVGTITGSLGSEASTRAAADAALGSRIDGVEGNLATEVSTRTSSDTTINGRIDSLQSTLNAHTSSSNTSAHTFGNIAGQISDGQVPASFTRDSELLFSNIGGTLSDSQIPANITRDGEVTTFIDSRISTLTGDGTLATGAALAAEASTRASADAALGSRIDGVASSIATESSTRAAAVTTLQSNIDTKVSKSGDTMTGNLSFNDSTCPDTNSDGLAGPCLVDGVDVSALASDVASIPRRTTVPFTDVTGHIADTQVPQYMRPASFGNIYLECNYGGIGDYDGDGAQERLFTSLSVSFNNSLNTSNVRVSGNHVNVNFTTVVATPYLCFGSPCTTKANTGLSFEACLSRLTEANSIWPASTYSYETDYLIFKN